MNKLNQIEQIFVQHLEKKLNSNGIKTTMKAYDTHELGRLVINNLLIVKMSTLLC